MTRSREELAHDVVMLDRQGMSVRAIARALHVGRNRVHKLLRVHEAARSGETPPTALPPPPASRASRLDVHEAFIRDLLARFPDITAQRSGARQSDWIRRTAAFGSLLTGAYAVGWPEAKRWTHEPPGSYDPRGEEAGSMLSRVTRTPRWDDPSWPR